MMPRILAGWIAAGAVLVSLAPSMAQDAMEVQRCIWRCQNANPSLGPSYQACVDARCNEPKARPPATPRPTAAARAPAPALAGSYAAPLGGVSASVAATNQPDTFDMRVMLSAPGCIGSLEGPARLEGGQLVLRQKAAGASEACTLSGTPSPSGLALKESGCAEYRGPTCSFETTLAMAGQPAARAMVPAGEAPKWVYGDHPLIGRSAHVVLGGEVFGLACGPGVDQDGQDAPGELRISPGLIKELGRSAGYPIVFEDPYFTPGSVTMSVGPRGYVALQGDTCGVHVRELQTARVMRFLKPELESVEFRGRTSEMTLRQDGRLIVARSQADLAAVEDAALVPLSGARAAIGQLLRECRVLRRAIQSGRCTDYN